MLYNASDELYEWKIHIQLKESYGWEDDSKELLATVKVHHKKWKKIKQQAGKAAGSGRGGGGSGKKMQFSLILYVHRADTQSICCTTQRMSCTSGRSTSS